MASLASERWPDFAGIRNELHVSHVDGRPVAAQESLPLQEHVRLDAGLPEDGAQRALWHVAGMVGYGGVAMGIRVVPDFMAPSGLAMELEPERLESPGDVAVAKAPEPPHQVATITG